MRSAFFVFLVLIALALLTPLGAALALAQAPSTMSYQGVLTDDLGNLVADGAYDLTFRIYDVSVGGVALWTEVDPGVAVVKGGFSVVLGLSTPIDLAFDQTYYLGVQVFADAELTPRVRLASSPYAMSLRLPFAQTSSSASPLVYLKNTGAGAELVADGEVEVGSTTGTGELRLYRSGSASHVLRAYVSSEGGNLSLHDELGSNNAFLTSDANGAGGFLSIYRSAAAAGFAVDGNYAGTGEPRVTVSGTARSAVFDLGATADASVILPADAISSAESFDEPGVASSNGTATVIMDGTPQVVLSRTITVPADGYVLAIGSLQADLIHTNGTLTEGEFGVSESSGFLPSTQDIQVQLPSTAPSGTYRFSVATNGLFTVSAGATTYYLLGQELSGSLSYSDRQLTLIYFPTAYGTVVSTLPTDTPAGVSGDDSPGASALPADLAAEQREARAFHLARLEREMRAMQDELDGVKRDLERETAVEASRAPRTRR